MQEYVGRLIGLKHLGYFIAPDSAQVSPVTIPENTELVELLTGGQVFFDVQGEQSTFTKGTIFWHRSGEHTIHRTPTNAPYRCIAFQFTVTDNNRPVPRVNFWNAHDESDIDHFVHETLSTFHAHTLDKNLLALYLYITLLRHALTVDNPTPRQSSHEPFDRAIKYINDHLKYKIAIADLARHCRVSQSHLFKLFQKNSMTTPHQYILSRQLSKARMMLAGTLSPIKEIALECGFENLEVFYRRFKQAAGMTPAKYRQRYLHPFRELE